MVKNNKIKAIGLLILSALSAILYRLGGIGKPFKTWMRDWIVPLCCYGALLLFWQPSVWWGWLLLVLSVLPTGGALTTYWDWLFKKDNFYMHGFMIGLGAFPLCFAGINWIMMLARAVLLAVFMGQLNYWVNKKQIKHSDWIEELGRGLAITLSVPLLALFAR
jgi:hypothetical protein